MPLSPSARPAAARAAAGRRRRAAPRAGARAASRAWLTSRDRSAKPPASSASAPISAQIGPGITCSMRLNTFAIGFDDPPPLLLFAGVPTPDEPGLPPYRLATRLDPVAPPPPGRPAARRGRARGPPEPPPDPPDARPVRCRRSRGTQPNPTAAAAGPELPLDPPPLLPLFPDPPEPPEPPPPGTPLIALLPVFVTSLATGPTGSGSAGGSGSGPVGGLLRLGWRRLADVRHRHVRPADGKLRGARGPADRQVDVGADPYAHVHGERQRVRDRRPEDGHDEAGACNQRAAD